jgi:hypothetical protein
MQYMPLIYTDPALAPGDPQSPEDQEDVGR